MDKPIGHALELGIAFLLFASALTFFLMMQQRVLTLERAGELGVGEASQVNRTGDVYVSEPVTKGDLYFLLTDEDRLGTGNWLNESLYTSSSVGIEVFIEGTHFPSVTDYVGKRSLRTSLAGLTSDLYDPIFFVDGSGRLSEIHFTGR